MEDVGADEVGAVGDAPAQAAAKIQKPVTRYRMFAPQRDSMSEAHLNKVFAASRRRDVPQLL